MFENLPTMPAAENPDLVAPGVAAALAHVPQACVFTIDPQLADTAALCAAYDLPLASCANCVLVTGKRAGDERHAACVVLATTRVDVNNVVRRRLDVRKASFTPMDAAVEMSGMEYGAITPLGLPAGWPVWVDRAVADAGWVCIGSGVRSSKIVLPAAELVTVPGVEIVDGLANPVAEH